jgi:hypothetical protein
MGDAYREAADAMSRAIPLAIDFGKKGRSDLVGLAQSLRGVKDQFASMLNHVVGFRTTIERSPRATTALNRARRRTIDSLDRFQSETLSIIQLTEMIERTANETLDNWPEDRDDDGVHAE